MENQNDEKYVSEVERARNATHAAIREEWEASLKASGGAEVAPTRIFAAIAARHGMTAYGVELVLRKSGLYEGARKLKESRKVEP